jgi:D-amino-acid dehydrogenase
MHVAVLGAGVIGVSTAHYLQRAGCTVTLIDRCNEVAAETSYANGGQISVSHAEPWATPRALRKLPAWLLHANSPLRLRPTTDPALWRWAFAFLRECQPARVRDNIGQLVRLGLYSRAQLQSLRDTVDLQYAQRTRGILHFYTRADEFAAASAAAALMREHGCERRVLSVDEAVSIEPALRHAAPRLAGATYTADDESGDARLFTQQLAAHGCAHVLQLLLGQRVDALHTERGRISHLTLSNAQGERVDFHADAYVLAAGSHSAALALPLGLRLPIQPAKGYSLTLPVRDPQRAFEVSLTDDEQRLVFSRLGDRMRIAGMAELGRVDTRIDPSRSRLLLARTEALFPGAADATHAEYWCGLRPSTPSNLPCIGSTRYPNLFLNTGHGTLGWTLACGSGQAVADLVCGRAPQVDFSFSRADAAG